MKKKKENDQEVNLYQCLHSVCIFFSLQTERTIQEARGALPALPSQPVKSTAQRDNVSLFYMIIDNLFFHRMIIRSIRSMSVAKKL